MTPVLVLAAGESCRMGQPKQLLPYRGSTLLRHAAETALATALGPVVIVLGAQADQCRDTLDGLAVRTTLNASWAEGMGGSIAAGVAELDSVAPAATGLLILLHDQPAVTAEHLIDLVAARREGDAIVAARYGDVVGVPAWFRCELFDELRRLRGPQGARKVINAHGAQLRHFELPEAALDIDTPADYQRIRG